MVSDRLERAENAFQSPAESSESGDQYRSAVFYIDEEQKRITEKLMEQLKAKGYDVATKLQKATTFWKAEGYHQDYYEKKGTRPYCHAYTKRF